MPEGDTLYKVSRALRPELIGQRLSRVELRANGAPGSVAAHHVDIVDALGKHLLIGLVTADGTVPDEQWVLRVHLGMHGSWHGYAPDERWQRPGHRASVVLQTQQRVLVCFDAAEVELLERRHLAAHRVLSRLGADLLAPTIELRHVLDRARQPAHAHRSVADLLLDQEVACGIGNVFKSEVLFVCRRNPWARVGELTDEALLALYGDARSLMQQNTGAGLRQTVHLPRPRHGRAPRHWVYGRAGRPCLQCATRILMAAQGDQGRVTYWCPRCQSGDGD